MMTKKFVSMFLALVMCLALSAPAFAVKIEDESKIKIIKDNEIERIVELQEGNLIYHVHYNKVSNIMTTQTIQDGKKIGESVFDPNRTTMLMPFASGIATPIQSKTGFGYILGETYNDYACSDELVENGRYQYHGIKLKKDSVTEIQKDFRATVDSLISKETELEYVESATVVTLVVAIALTAIIAPGAAAAQWASLALSLDGEKVAIEIRSLTKTCESYYSMLYPYRVVM